LKWDQNAYLRHQLIKVGMRMEEADGDAEAVSEKSPDGAAK